MKGLAIPAWTLLVLMLAGWQAPADAAAPRDAIRKLPSIRHTTRWITQNDNQELFQSIWDVNWNSGDINTGAFSGKLSFDYQLNLSDNQEADGNFTRNIRGDIYRFRLDLNRRGYLSGNYVFQHNETSSDRHPSEGRRNMELTQLKSAFLELNPKDAPRFSITMQERNTVNHNGYNLNRGNDDIYWKGFAEYKGETSRGGYNVQFHNESRLSRVLSGANEQSTSQNKFQVNGSRNMAIGNMGRMQMQVAYVEDSDRNNLQDEQNTKTDLNYLLSFGGDLPGYPFSYNYVFKARHWGNLDNASNRSMERQLQLQFRPPMPQGRDMSVVYVSNLQDFDNENNSTATTRQNINISFRANPRTTAQLMYYLQNDFNNISEQMTQELARLEGKLDYKQPGGRSSYQLGMLQQQTIGANRRDTRDYTKYSYSANSALGQGANIRMEVSQAYDDNFSAGSLVNTPTDNLQTRFIYDFGGQVAGGAGGSFNLNAVWERNLLRREISQQKNDQHVLRINFAYNTNASWRYELHLQSGDGWSYNGGGEFTDRYSTSDRIEAKVSHTF